MAASSQVFLVGHGCRQVASELLRWGPSSAFPSSYTPPVRVVNKYFTANIDLQCVDTADEAIPEVQAASRDAGVVFGGVLLVSGDTACSASLGPIRAEWFVFPSTAAFRVLLLCLSDQLYEACVAAPSSAGGGGGKGGALLLLDAWQRSCAQQGYELVVHKAIDDKNNSKNTDDDGDVVAPSNYETIPVGMERRGIFHADDELQGSARLLQLLHNTMWVTPGGGGDDSARLQASSSTSDRNTPSHCLLVVGDDEGEARRFLQCSGCVITTTSSSCRSGAAPSSSKKRVAVLRWLHAYGQGSLAFIFLPAAIFAPHMSDCLHHSLPDLPIAAVVFCEEGQQRRRRRPGAAGLTTQSVQVLQRLLRATTDNRNTGCDTATAQQQQQPMLWISSDLDAHAAHVAAVESLGVEFVVMAVGNDSLSLAVKDDHHHDDDDDDDGATGGPRRVHEWLSCVVGGDPVIAARCNQQNIPANSVLWIALDENVDVDDCFRLMLDGGGGGALSLSDASSTVAPSTSLSNKYYNATIDHFWCGPMPPARSSGRSQNILKQFFVIILVGDAAPLRRKTAEESEGVKRLWRRFSETWSPLLGDEEEWLDSERGHLLWLRHAERKVMTDTVENWNVEVVIDSDPSNHAETDHDDDDVGKEGIARVIEMLASTKWPDLHPTTEERNSSRDGGQQELELTVHSADVSNSHAVSDDDEEAHTLATTLQQISIETTKATSSSSQPLTTAAEDDNVELNKWQGCEPPSTMLIDPDTLRTVYVPALDRHVAAHTKDEEEEQRHHQVLAEWMQKMKHKGHLLRREDRQRQALLLAEKLSADV